MNWFDGTPRTIEALLLVIVMSFTSPSYCGVSPHFEATFTIEHRMPLELAERQAACRRSR